MTQIEGGTASNVVPVPCWFGWETRALPGVDPFTLQRQLEKFSTEVCLPQMRQLAPEAEIKIRTVQHVSAYAADTKSGIVPLTLKLAGQNETLAVTEDEIVIFDSTGSGVQDVAAAWVAYCEGRRTGIGARFDLSGAAMER